MKNVRAFKYIKDNTLAIIGEELVIAKDDSTEVLHKSQLSERVNIAEVVST